MFTFGGDPDQIETGPLLAYYRSAASTVRYDSDEWFVFPRPLFTWAARCFTNEFPTRTLPVLLQQALDGDDDVVFLVRAYDNSWIFAVLGVDMLRALRDGTLSGERKVFDEPIIHSTPWPLPF